MSRRLFECKEVPRGPIGEQRPWDAPYMRPKLDDRDRFPTDAPLPGNVKYPMGVANIRKDD